MKKLALTLLILPLGLLAFLAPTAAREVVATPSPQLRLGTFDSRIVAISYYRSNRFQDALAGLGAEHEAAEAADDKATMERIEKEMQARQQLVHRQSFGNAPIPEIIDLLEDDLATVAGNADVDAIVSKWDVIYVHPDAKTTDVSLLLADSFEPDAKTIKILKDMLDIEPVELEQIELRQH
jgi:hypothetical protein